MNAWNSLDARVVTEGLTPAVAGALRDHWGHPASGEIRRSLVLRMGTLPPAPPPGPVPPGLPDELAVRVRGDEVWIGPALHLRVWDGGAEVTVGEDGHAPPGAAWTLALAEAHRAGGWLALHAAVLTPAPGQEKRGAALSGPSGAGKSTAALRWVGVGGGLMAEDQTWVWPGSGRAVGLDRWLRSWEEGVRRFAPEWLPRAEGADAHGKLRLPLIAPGGEVPLAALLVFGLPPQPTASERVRALWEATGVPLTALGRRRGAAGVGALLERLPVRGVTREDVLGAAGQALGLPGLPESARPPGSAGG